MLCLFTFSEILSLFVNIFLFDFLDWLIKGRRRELIIASVLYLLGGLITGNAPGLGVLLVGRLLYGLGIGLVNFL